MAKKQPAGKTVYYASVGEQLDLYDVDVAEGSLTKRGSVSLPKNVHYVVQDAESRFLYVASSDRGMGSSATGSIGDTHHLSAFRIDPETGELTLHGERLALPSRPIHITLDHSGGFILVAYNLPSSLNVFRLNEDGTLGAEIKQPADLDQGIYAHQVRVAPSNRTVILVTRGNQPTATKAEDPGALKVYDFNDGVLTNRASVAPGRGYGFGPRHIEFHPTKPWLFVALERQNQLAVFDFPGDELADEPKLAVDNLIDPSQHRHRQHGGTVHVHPNGRFAYMPNRSDQPTDFNGQTVFEGGENNMAVYAIDQESGEPSLIQHIPVHGFIPRTFSINPSGRLMAVANQQSMLVREGDSLRNVTAGLDVFRIGEDGRLEYVRTYPIEGEKHVFWSGFVRLP